MNGPGLRYEIALAIRSGLIVWINGPFPCGAYPDSLIFEMRLKDKLGENERVEADEGYKKFDPIHAVTPAYATGNARQELSNKVRARQETINRRFKQWNALGKRFRHDLDLHHVVFEAVAVITQLAILNGEKLFEINNYVD